MNSDDRTRAAFDDLRHRADSVDPQYSLQRLRRDEHGKAPRWVPALVGAVTVLALFGGVIGFFRGPEVTDTTSTTTPVTTTVSTAATTIPVTTTDGTDPTTTTIPPESTVWPTHRVTNVADDDVLFVRRDPAPGGEPYAELPPDYAGIVSLGTFETADDGGTWMQVRLIDPIRLIDIGEPLHGAPIVGWVNAAFLEEYDPTFPEVDYCQGSGAVPPAGDGLTPDHVYSIRQYGLGGCIRTVVRFGANWDTEWGYFYDRITTDVRPAATPTISIEDVNGVTVVVLEGIPYTSVTEVGEVGAKVGRWTDGSLAIFTMVPGFTDVTVHDGHLLIDTTPIDGSAPSSNRVHLLGEPIVGEGGTLEVWGLARPFEATLGTQLSDPSADAPPFVMTNDYLDAWGLFRYRALDVEPGPGTVTFLQDSEDAQVPSVFEFVMPDRTQTVTQDDVELADAVRNDGVDALGDGWTAWLGVDHSQTGSTVIDVDEWNGYGGPFDVLGPLLADGGPVLVTVGPHDHCAGPPLDLPSDFDGLRQVSIQPTGITSCIEWYAVDLFVDGSGEVLHVMLDLWEP